MKEYTCANCGATVTYSERNTIVTCPQCGAFCKVRVSERISRSRAAVSAKPDLKNKEPDHFEKQRVLLDQRLQADPESPDLLFLRALCDMRVDYLDNESGYSLIPYRVGAESIEENVFLKQALTNAAEDQKQSIRQAAERLAAFRSAVDPILHAFPEIDIYLEDLRSTDAKSGGIADQLYDSLSHGAIRVFMREKDKPDLSDEQYAPYEYCALNKAKILLLLCEKPDQLTYPDIQSTCSRFMYYKQYDDPGKEIILCLEEGMLLAPPTDISSAHLLSMHKIDFNKRLTGLINEILGTELASVGPAEQPGEKAEHSSSHSRGSVAHRSTHHIKLEDVTSSAMPKDYYSVSEQGKKKNGGKRAVAILAAAAILGGGGYFGYRAYTGKKDRSAYETAVTAQQEGRYLEALSLFESLSAKNYPDADKQIILTKRMEAQRLTENGAWDNALALLSSLPADKETEEAKNSVLYKKAVSLQESKDWDGALEIFNSLSGYSDAESRAAETRYLKAAALQENNDPENAILQFEALGDYRDASYRVHQCRGDILLNAGDYASAYIEYGLAGDGYHGHEDVFETEYLAGRQLMEAGSWEAAAKKFRSLGEYTDSAALARDCEYQKALSLVSAGDPASAAALFDTLGAPEEAALARSYGQAEQLVSEGKTEEALNAFRALGTFGDAAGRADALCTSVYTEAEALRESGDVAGAVLLYETIPEYLPAAERQNTIETDYASAKAAYDAEEWYRAISLLSELRNYRDSEELYLSARLKKAEKLTANGNYAEAEEAYEALSDETDVTPMLNSLKLLEAEEARLNGDYQAALDGYRAAEQTEETKAAMYSLAADARNAGQLDFAHDLFAELADYSDADIQVKETVRMQAEAALAENDLERAAELFSGLGEYGNAAAGLNECTYREALALMESGDTAGAKALFASLPDDPDAREQIQECDYRNACILMENGNWEEAASAFSGLNGYKDSNERKNTCIFNLALSFFDKGAYDQAEALFLKIPEVQGADSYLNECVYQKALAFADKGELEQALALAEQCKGDQAAALIRRVHLLQADEMVNEGRTEEAAALYLEEKEDPLAQSALISMADLLAAEGDYTGAYGLLSSLPLTEEVKGSYFALALIMDAEGSDPAQIEAMLYLAGDHEDADDRFIARAREIGEPELRQAASLFGFDGETVGALVSHRSEVLPESEFRYAEKLLDDGVFEEAKARFAALKDHPNASDRMKECDYRRALYLLENGNSTEALKLLTTLGDYSDAAQIIASDETLSVLFAENARVIAFSTVGQRVSLGFFRQSTDPANEAEAIEWIVLHTGDDRALLLSASALIALPYSTDQSTVWETSTIRSWLNGEFLSSAFTEEERELLIGGSAEDKVFLLSIAEVTEYLPEEEDRICKVTPYAKASGKYHVYKDDIGSWWLRDSGYNRENIATVSGEGSILEIGNRPDEKWLVIRPALWLDLSRLN